MEIDNKFNAPTTPASQTRQTRPTFVSQPDDKYICAYCRDILLPEVKQTMCGHRLCGACVPRLFHDSNAPMCPGNEDCTVLKTNEIHPDIATTKELRRMLVFCAYRGNGCGISTKWSDVGEHETSCGYATVECHNPGCGLVLLRSGLKDHEQQECGYVPTRCEVCEEYVPRKELQQEHTQHCRPKPKKCPYVVLGCSFEGTPGDLKDHKRACAEEHQEQLLQMASTLSQEHQTLKQQFGELVSHVGDLETSVAAFQSNSHDNNKLHRLMSSVAKLNEDVIEINQTLTAKANQKDLTEYESKVVSMQVRMADLERNGGATTSEEIVHKIRQVENSNNAYDIRFAEFDIRFRLLETAGYDGRMIWKITDYTQRKKHAEDGRTLSLYSQPFYTSRYGYRMCARAYLNGDGMGRGTHLSLFFVVMRGDHDALLAWPFRSRVTLCLMDLSGSRRHIQDTFRPDPTSTSFRRPMGEMNIASGSPMFATHSTVESDKYLRDDTIFIRVSVDTSDLEDM